MYNQMMDNSYNRYVTITLPPIAPPTPRVSKTYLFISDHGDKHKQQFNDYLYVDRCRNNPEIFRGINHIFKFLQRFRGELPGIDNLNEEIWYSDEMFALY